MRKTLLIFLLILLTPIMLPAANAKTPLETPTTGAEFEKIIGELETEAKAFAETGDDKGPLQSKAVRKLQYRPESSAPLGEAIKKSLPRKPLARMYTLSALLKPLEMASDETISPLVPALMNLLGNDCRYISIPALPKASLALLAKSEKARQKKADDERAVIKYNRTVNALEKTIKHLLVMINDRAADEALLQRLNYEHSRNRATFEDTLAVIKSEAGRMKQDRAKKFYERLKTLAFRSRRPKQYSDPTRPIYKADRNSSFESRQINFAASIIEVVNVLATAAQEPAVRVPGEKPPERRRRTRPRR